ncbi:hypothetical protein C7B69_26330 [filamentous cyanobacterium Phorm 46]|nr:hypothetical protein C7B69_26330 [filamentous cyanobacterium Phorm 46]PSB40616.1 hypothetical protein C7B67_27955 [filamentous cyanobacterium Phorm 6]
MSLGVPDSGKILLLVKKLRFLIKVNISIHEILINFQDNWQDLIHLGRSQAKGDRAKFDAGAG